ncbi:MAG: cell division protein FtsI [Actinophytocola sp.]|nr:cell division protein FtsI [Actinophytocola sp.]
MSKPRRSRAVAPGRAARKPARPRTGAARGVSAKRVGAKPRRRTRPKARSRLRRRIAGWGGNRYTTASVILVAVLSFAGVKLVYLQAFQAEALSERAERQRATMIDIPARRGSILDRNGTELAFSVETRTLQVNLRVMRETWRKVAQEQPDSGQDFQTRAAEISKFMAEKLPGLTTEQELLERFNKSGPFTFLVHNVEPSAAAEITAKYPEIAEETRAFRDYPGGRLASNVVGFANWRTDDPDRTKHNIHGLIGLESLRDNDLAGRPGRRLVDTGEGDNVVIPGTEREINPAVAGSDIELTLDSDLQYDLQQRLSDYVGKTRAKGGSAVIMDARTGEVYALANDKTFDPENVGSAPEAEMNNRAVTTPYEPGSVNKVVTAAAALEHGVTTPDARLRVPGRIEIADRVVRDAWPHGTLNFTTTGIFAKSSNVGTLLLAQQLGEDRWLETAKKFGLGQRTGVGLPGESPGRVPPRNQWSGSTFGNLPIGQGLSMTVLQMAGMYQAIANGGVRVEPRVVSAKVSADGTRTPDPASKRTRVVSEKTAGQVLKMLKATTQRGKPQDTGTAPAAAVSGYQIAGKTGTAQQINPVTGTYSRSKHTITFAGILPAEDPRFVVGIMLDAPDTTLPLGHNAAPLFHDIASYLAQRYEIPLSPKRAPVVPLIVD